MKFYQRFRQQLRNFLFANNNKYYVLDKGQVAIIGQFIFTTNLGNLIIGSVCYLLLMSFVSIFKNIF